MMKSVGQVKEAKADKLARESEQKRAEAAQLEETQALLRSETLRRMRRFGQLAGASTSLAGFFGGGGVGGGTAGNGVGGGLDGGMGGYGGIGAGVRGLQIGQF